jgi:dethiobiotin synthetase
MGKGYFVTATDTDAGKTFVSSGLLYAWAQQGYQCLGLKPIASGCQMTVDGLRNEDALQLMMASSITVDYDIVNPYAFTPAIAPHIAAQQANINLHLPTIAKQIKEQQKKTDYLLVEGVGGWLVPLNAEQTLADLASLLNYPIILVVNIRLGCINHALLTAQAIAQQGLTLAAWVANINTEKDSMACIQENIESLKQRINAPLLASLPHTQPTEVAHFIDWSQLTL